MESNSKMFALLPLHLLLVCAPQSFSGGEYQRLDRWTGETSGSFYGESLASLGDINADGLDDFVVGSPRLDVGTLGSAGRVYAKSGFDGSVIHSWDGHFSKANFGKDVDCAGDVNGDGIDDIIVGAIGDLSTVPGYVRVFSGADGSLLHHIDAPKLGDNFGREVCTVGDVNLDGYPDFAIASRPKVMGVQNHTVGVYSGFDASVLHQMTGTGINQFGFTLAPCPDLNQDQIPDLLIGAPRTPVNATKDAGAAYAYSGADGSQLLQWTGSQPGEYFGFCIIYAGDLNGDGIGEIAVTSQNYNHNGLRDPGAVFLFSAADGHLLHIEPGQSQSLHYGNQLAALTDTNGNGSAELLCGTFFYTTGFPGGTGLVDRLEFLPYLEASGAEISASNGASLSFSYDFPQTAAGYQYRTLISATGVGPVHFGINIPLSMDPILTASVQGNYYGTTASNFQGQLDANGHATSSAIVAPLPISLIGRTLYLAAVAHPLGLLPDFSSGALPLKVVP